MSKIVEARSFIAEEESEMWEWLGDAYISSSDHTSSNESGESETSVTLLIKTRDGEKQVMEGDVIVKKEGVGFYVLTDAEAREQLLELEETDLQ